MRPTIITDAAGIVRARFVELCTACRADREVHGLGVVPGLRLVVCRPVVIGTVSSRRSHYIHRRAKENIDCFLCIFTTL
jgi:hypothetical protein